MGRGRDWEGDARRERRGGGDGEQPALKVCVDRQQPLDHYFNRRLKLRWKGQCHGRGKMREIAGGLVGVERDVGKLWVLAATMVFTVADLALSSGSHVDCT